jgi:WHG domain-containing protein
VVVTRPVAMSYTWPETLTFGESKGEVSSRSTSALTVVCGWFATAFALPQQHAYDARDDRTGRDPRPLDQLRAVLDELADAGVLYRQRRDGIEYPIWATVHGLAVLTGQGPLRDVPGATRRHLEELTFTFIARGLA